MARAIRRSLGVAALVVSAAAASSAKVDVHTTLACPPEVLPRQLAELSVTLENRECSARSVRILSSIAANTGQTAGSSSVLGPVFMWETVVPAANCQTFTPSVVQFSRLYAGPVVPDSFEGTLASYQIVSEWGAGAKTETQRCLIPVPEPSTSTQIVSGALGLILLSRLRRRSAVPTRERRR